MKDPTIDRIDVSAYTIPTDFPESDGTLDWDSTTLIVVEAHGGGQSGLGYTYGDLAAASLIERLLAPAIEGRDVMAEPGAWSVMNQLLRNVGRSGIGSMAIAAVDSALWDLKARLLNLPLVTLLGSVRNGIPVYGSGGFTSYPLDRLQQQVGEWVNRGILKVKMKVGREPLQDLPRVEAARSAIGPNVELFVDANGAYTRKQALRFAESFAQYGVTWFEEPVSSDDLEGLKLLRNRAPAGMAIAAGEYGYDSFYFVACSRRDRWTSFKLMRHVVVESQDSCKLESWPMHTTCRYRRIPRHHFTLMYAVRSMRPVMWSTFMITYESKECCSTAFSKPLEERFVRISRARDWVSTSNVRMRQSMRHKR
jgi:L-alanine-DL-glutamate epimerase-like enolase superfamily enzyme